MSAVQLVNVVECLAFALLGAAQVAGGDLAEVQEDLGQCGYTLAQLDFDAGAHQLGSAVPAAAVSTPITATESSPATVSPVGSGLRKTKMKKLRWPPAPAPPCPESGRARYRPCHQAAGGTDRGRIAAGITPPWFAIEEDATGVPGS
jgi:hypothetical protein